MNIKYFTVSLIVLLLMPISISFTQVYPDQLYVLRIDSIYSNIETNEGMKLSPDGKSIILEDGVTYGYLILKPQYSQSPFNEGLPSWNGTAPDNNSGFRVQMRFPYNGGWSPWLTVGYWESNILGTYTKPTYDGGYIDYDNVKLYSYQNSWQFKIIIARTTASVASPTIKKLSFFVSDSRTTSDVNIASIVNDKPQAIFIPTNFVYQYDVDPNFGKDICSPTSVAMIIKSYNIYVDPRSFAIDNYDTNFDMYGIWPRAVQNASEYGLDGAVTRYRTWSEAYEVLVNGGRIALSVGLPLYSGHLMMLAGFTSDGNPIVHDPAKSNGYSFVFDKTQLSQSWFNKGGVAYTFYLPDSVTSTSEYYNEHIIADAYQLYQNYPNPFNPSTSIQYSIASKQLVRLKVYDVLGNEIATLVNEEQPSGTYNVQFTIDNLQLSSGTYFYQLQAGSFVETKKMILLR